MFRYIHTGFTSLTASYISYLTILYGNYTLVWFSLRLLFQKALELLNHKPICISEILFELIAQNDISLEGQFMYVLMYVLQTLLLQLLWKNEPLMAHLLAISRYTTSVKFFCKCTLQWYTFLTLTTLALTGGTPFRVVDNLGWLPLPPFGH